MTMVRVYLETSFVSACVTTRTSLRSVYERESSLRWWQDQATSSDRFISDEVLNELSHPKYPSRDRALEFVREVSVLGISEAMISFAQALVDRLVMPRPAAGDALHIAIATISHMDVILTWNVRHLANPNKVLHLYAICSEFGYLCPKVLRPDDLMELEP